MNLRGSPMPDVRRSLVAMALTVCATGCGVPSDVLPGTDEVSASPESSFITHRGIRLHYLDWGGDGPAVVLLPGYALTAHVFEEIGDVLAEDHRVLAMTPMGFGESDAPDSGAYEIATMVADVAALLDSLAIPQAALVGHSISGSTISEFAMAFPERVTRLVYLDAFPYFAEAGGDSIDALNPVMEEGFAGEMTYDRVREFLATHRFGGWSPALEADLRANTLGPDLIHRRELTAGYVADQRRSPPNLERVAVPALQVCAVPTTDNQFPWLEVGEEEYAQAESYVAETLQPFSRRLCERFEELVPSGRTTEVSGSHYVFFTDPSSAAAVIRRFLGETVPSSPGVR